MRKFLLHLALLLSLMAGAVYAQKPEWSCTYDQTADSVVENICGGMFPYKLRPSSDPSKNIILGRKDGSWIIWGAGEQCNTIILEEVEENTLTVKYIRGRSTIYRQEEPACTRYPGILFQKNGGEISFTLKTGPTNNRGRITYEYTLNSEGKVVRGLFIGTYRHYWSATPAPKDTTEDAAPAPPPPPSSRD